MDCIEAINTRRSIRSFLPDEVSPQDIQTILEAGRYAPTAGNLQPCYFIVVKDADTIKKIHAATFGQELIAQAPTVIIVCADPDRCDKYGEKGRQRFSLIDCANATENMLLAAHALGYGACWVGGFSEKEVRNILSIPETFHVVAMIPIGKPNGPPVPRIKRPLEEIVRWEKWC